MTALKEGKKLIVRLWWGQMKPIRFVCNETVEIAPQAVAAQILDVLKWTEFRGYGFVPGIKSAEFERQTPDIIGSRIQVTNTDGSTHIEEIVEWLPDSCI